MNSTREPSLTLCIGVLVATMIGAGVVTRYLLADYFLFAVIGVAFWFMGGAVIYHPRRWLLGDAIFTGLSFGIVIACLEVIYRFLSTV